jgi:hypothetical protein
VDEMDRACRTNGVEEEYIYNIGGESQKKRDY